ncbi:quaternary amine ABC transporter ATP-binding protein [Salisediminibacterium halotolerans]|uniref:Quaternary amine transport ATP-binding protein n=1 Tax=Salisediminibacterium halotolerans TaxID=517425 RepID=A0A1H9SNF4_9BACI|nr:MULTISPECIES: glycine betaine/L-proline ABC transporter ATP-binding protein [Salisediminibacterium]RLJ73278.1 glycine betaine/proline transport system ATP-binding protein [Actinophytocola xinjiangensis]RPE86700.1 glycine betaine/proline transport system ATP-binding protein [Salisediminibacterium halotolerans]TWG34075.1 glycine betaine/proline transport system ATP-binding protein [Salisediminibacterium halotolerans]SER86275.1 glycine betaine/proline transport system ATP-binding protein [Salis
MSEIKVEGLTKIFGKRPKQGLKLLDEGKTKDEILEETGLTVGVNKADFEVDQGEIFVIMGLSGSGKSTLVRLLNRLIEPTGGKVWLNDEDLAAMDDKQLREVRRKKMGMVFQKFGLFPFRTILDNVVYGLEVQGISEEDRMQKAQNALELVGLKGYENQYPDQLSGGMQQRVGLARALANDPPILLMDEAFSALDPLIRKDMQDELLDLQTKMQKTIIFITHDLDEALRIGDRITIMKDGAIVQVGTPEEILTNPANDYVERFVEDVDRSKVYTVKNIMVRPETVNLEKDGPRVALQRMRDADISSIYVTNKNRELEGICHAAEVSAAVKEDAKDLRPLLHTEVPTVDEETPVHDVFDMVSTSNVPIAVVDENNRLRGIVIRSKVLAALSGKEVNLDA